MHANANIDAISVSADRSIPAAKLVILHDIALLHGITTELKFVWHIATLCIYGPRWIRYLYNSISRIIEKNAYPVSSFLVFGDFRSIVCASVSYVFLYCRDFRSIFLCILLLHPEINFSALLLPLYLYITLGYRKFLHPMGPRKLWATPTNGQC